MPLSPYDCIAVRCLGRISNTPSHPIKFILIEDGTLLFGKAQWHKDLLRSFIEQGGMPAEVIAAGGVPLDIEERGLDDEDWGGWKSTGFGVRTPLDRRGSIRDALLPFAPLIAELSN